MTFDPNKPFHCRDPKYLATGFLVRDSTLWPYLATVSGEGRRFAATYTQDGCVHQPSIGLSRPWDLINDEEKDEMPTTPKPAPMAELYHLQSEIANCIARCQKIVADMPELPTLDVQTPTEKGLQQEERRCGVERRNPSVPSRRHTYQERRVGTGRRGGHLSRRKPV